MKETKTNITVKNRRFCGTTTEYDLCSGRRVVGVGKIVSRTTPDFYPFLVEIHGKNGQYGEDCKTFDDALGILCSVEYNNSKGLCLSGCPLSLD
jgi:hypothetical protein